MVEEGGRGCLEEKRAEEVAERERGLGEERESMVSDDKMEVSWNST